jgi:hypothetical protein
MPGGWGFCGPTYVAQSQNVDDEDAMNCYCEQSGSSGAKTPIALLHTPGKKVFATFPESSIPGDFTVNGRTFFAAGQLYETDAAGNVTIRGDLGASPATPTMMTANETQLVILNNGNLFVLVLATNDFSAVDMSQFNGPIAQIGFIDGYIIATLEDSHTFQQSNLEDATTWSGLNVATLSYFPDNIVSMACYARTIQFSSGKKSLWYYNSGQGFPVFIPIQGAVFETGSAATFGICQVSNNAVCWLAQDERGSLIAMMSTQFAGQRISTHATEFAWQRYAVTADAVSFSYQEYGHTFWVVYFPTANATWVFDLTTGLWHKRGFWNAINGTYAADRAMCHTLNFGLHLVGDWATGTVYVLSSTFCTDFGNAIRGYRRSPTLSDENKWIYFPQIEFDVEVGLGVSAFDAAQWLAVQKKPPLIDGDGNARSPQLMLHWSDDAGKTWSNWYYLPVGNVGNYDARVIKRMLGRARKRIWEVAWTDPIPWRFADAYVHAMPQER